MCPDIFTFDPQQSNAPLHVPETKPKNSSFILILTFSGSVDEKGNSVPSPLDGFCTKTSAEFSLHRKAVVGWVTLYGAAELFSPPALRSCSDSFAPRAGILRQFMCVSDCSVMPLSMHTEHKASVRDGVCVCVCQGREELLDAFCHAIQGQLAFNEKLMRGSLELTVSGTSLWCMISCVCVCVSRRSLFIFVFISVWNRARERERDEEKGGRRSLWRFPQQRDNYVLKSREADNL